MAGSRGAGATARAGLRLQQLQQPLEGGDYPQRQGLEPSGTMLGCPYGVGEIWFFLHPQPEESFLSRGGQLWKCQCRAKVRFALMFKGS